MVDAICLQATLVFGLLRYARNDKNQDGHTAFAMTTLNLPAVLVTREQLVIARRVRFFLRSLSVSLPRVTLVAWWTQSACKQHLFLDYFATLVMTRTKMAARLKASRHDNLLLDRHTTFAMTSCFFPRHSLVKVCRTFRRSVMPTRTSALGAALACEGLFAI